MILSHFIKNSSNFPFILIRKYYNKYILNKKE